MGQFRNVRGRERGWVRERYTSFGCFEQSFLALRERSLNSLNIYVKTVFSSHMEIVFSSHMEVLHKWSHSPDCILTLWHRVSGREIGARWAEECLVCQSHFWHYKSENKATICGKKKTTTVWQMEKDMAKHICNLKSMLIMMRYVFPPSVY